MTLPSDDTLLILIEKDSTDGSLANHLQQNGLVVRDRYPPVNGPIGDMLANPAPWLSASGAVALLATSIHAYAKYSQKRAVIRKFVKGIEIELVNYSADEIRLIDTLDILEFRDDKNKKDK